MVTPVKYETTCRLCGQKFRGAPLQAAVDGIPDSRMQKMGKALWDHLLSGDQGHRDFAVHAVLVSGYQFEDPNALQFVSLVRAMVFQAVRRHWITDEWIHDQASRITPEQFEAIMIDMRDFLTETGKHAPRIAAPAPPAV
jgi:hypothetical protein